MNNNSDNRYNNQSANVTHGGVSKGELFVGINLLSKIGVLFIVAGIIAFSAVSEGYIPAVLRMAMVLLVGVFMLVGGEVFRRKGSEIFASALTMGGVAELFVSVLIGQLAFSLWGGTTSQIIGLVVAAIGLFLSIRYKNQVLLIVTQIAACLPIFAANKSIFAVVIGAVCLVAVHAGAAILSRKKNYAVPYIVGVCLTMFQPVFVLAEFVSALNYEYGYGNYSFFAYDYHFILVLFFALCSCVCYVGGLFLNAAQDGGRLCTWETITVCIALFPILIEVPVYLHSAFFAEITAGVGSLVLAMLLAITAVGFELHFGGKTKASELLFHFAIPSTVIGLCMCLCGSQIAPYIALHIFSSILIAVGVLTERKTFSGWGFAILGVSEILLLTILVTESGAQRAAACIVNLVLWFAVMAVYIVKKRVRAAKPHSLGLRLYTCAAFFNAGLLLNIAISNDLYSALRNAYFSGVEARYLCILLVACVWLVLGFAVGKPTFLKNLGLGWSIAFYAIGMGYLLFSNIMQWIANVQEYEFSLLYVLITIIVNLVSVITVLDLTLQITARKSAFGKCIGLIVSSYGLASLTAVLGINNTVAFTSWIISIIYIAAAALWIVVGFLKQNAILRRFGLALALLSSAKLFLFDFRGLNPIAKTLMFIGFGITLLAISFGYGIAEKKLKTTPHN